MYSETGAVAGGESRRKMRYGEERTIPCAHDGTKMQSPGINEENPKLLVEVQPGGVGNEFASWR